MPQWVNASLFLALWAFFGKNREIFMAAICDMALGRLADRRYFLGIVHDWIKTGFMRKKGQFLHTNGIYCVLFAIINSSKQRKDNQCLSRYRWCLLSVYHDIVTCSQWKLNNFLFFISFVDNHISPYFLMFVWWHESRYQINYSHFFRGGCRGVFQWCNVRAHKIIISACTIDFRPTLTYQSTSSDLRQ